MLCIVLCFLCRDTFAQNCYDTVELGTHTQLSFFGPLTYGSGGPTTTVNFFTENSDGTTTPIHGMSELSSGVDSDGRLCGFKGKFDDGADTAWGVDGTCEAGDWTTFSGLNNVHFTGMRAAHSPSYIAWLRMGHDGSSSSLSGTNLDFAEDGVDVDTYVRPEGILATDVTFEGPIDRIIIEQEYAGGPITKLEVRTDPCRCVTTQPTLGSIQDLTWELLSPPAAFEPAVTFAEDPAWPNLDRSSCYPDLNLASSTGESVLEVSPGSGGLNLVSVNESLLDLESLTYADFTDGTKEISMTAQVETPATWAPVSGSNPVVTGLTSNEEAFALTITEPCTSRPIVLADTTLSVTTALGTPQPETMGRTAVSLSSGAAMPEIDQICTTETQITLAPDIDIGVTAGIVESSTGEKVFAFTVDPSVDDPSVVGDYVATAQICYQVDPSSCSEAVEINITIDHGCGDLELVGTPFTSETMPELGTMGTISAELQRCESTGTVNEPSRCQAAWEVERVPADPASLITTMPTDLYDSAPESRQISWESTSAADGGTYTYTQRCYYPEWPNNGAVEDVITVTVVDCENERSCVCATLEADNLPTTVQHTVRATYEADSTSSGSETLLASALALKDASGPSGENFLMSSYSDCPIEAVLERWDAGQNAWVAVDSSGEPSSSWLSLNSQNELVVLPGEASYNSIPQTTEAYPLRVTYTPTGSTQAAPSLVHDFDLSMASCSNFDWNGYQTPPSAETSFTHNVLPPLANSEGQSTVSLAAPTGYPAGEGACAEAAEVKYFYKDETGAWVEMTAGSGAAEYMLGAPTSAESGTGETTQEWVFAPGLWTNGDVADVTQEFRQQFVQADDPDNVLNWDFAVTHVNACYGQSITGWSSEAEDLSLKITDTYTQAEGRVTSAASAPTWSAPAVDGSACDQEGLLEIKVDGNWVTIDPTDETYYSADPTGCLDGSGGSRAVENCGFKAEFPWLWHSMAGDQVDANKQVVVDISNNDAYSDADLAPYKAGPVTYEARWKWQSTNSEVAPVYDDFTVTIDYACASDTLSFGTGPDDHIPDAFEYTIGDPEVPYSRPPTQSEPGCSVSASCEQYDPAAAQWVAIAAEPITQCGTDAVAVSLSPAVAGTDYDDEPTVQYRVVYTSDNSLVSDGTNEAIDTFDVTYLDYCSNNEWMLQDGMVDLAYEIAADNANPYPMVSHESMAVVSTKDCGPADVVLEQFDPVTNAWVPRVDASTFSYEGDYNSVYDADQQAMMFTYGVLEDNDDGAYTDNPATNYPMRYVVTNPTDDTNVVEVPFNVDITWECHKNAIVLGNNGDGISAQSVVGTDAATLTQSATQLYPSCPSEIAVSCEMRDPDTGAWVAADGPEVAACTLDELSLQVPADQTADFWPSENVDYRVRYEVPDSTLADDAGKVVYDEFPVRYHHECADLGIEAPVVPDWEDLVCPGYDGYVDTAEFTLVNDQSCGVSVSHAIRPLGTTTWQTLDETTPYRYDRIFSVSADGTTVTRTYDDEDPALFNPEAVFEVKWSAALTDPTHGDATAEVVHQLTMKDCCIEN